MAGPAKLARSVIDQIRADTKAGMTIVETAKKNGVSPGSVKRYRRKEPDVKQFFDPEAKYEWPVLDTMPLYTQAACLGENPGMFEYDQEEVPGLPWAEWQESIEYAITVCSKCPVIALCYQAATPEEQEYTVRGGLEPLAYLRDGLAMGVLD